MRTIIVMDLILAGGKRVKVQRVNGEGTPLRIEGVSDPISGDEREEARKVFQAAQDALTKLNS